jgi:hypothetical protein
MTEIQKAMLALYRACKNQYNSKDSCRGCLLVDAESIELAGGDDYFSTCEANYPKVWDAFHPWLKEDEDDDNA